MSKNKKDLERQLARFKMGWPETDEALEQGIRIMEERIKQLKLYRMGVDAYFWGEFCDTLYAIGSKVDFDDRRRRMLEAIKERTGGKGQTVKIKIDKRSDLELSYFLTKFHLGVEESRHSNICFKYAKPVAY